ncbi:MAG: biliverdin-producing heme oxygenase [Phycisphaerales bacterium]|nr:biliverdin-producing heme oxygenase [Phycisphaerales bacterium]
MAAPSKATGFHLKLREGTQQLHDQAEAGDLQDKMVNGTLSKEEFTSFIAQMKLVHAALEPALTSASTGDNRIEKIFDEDHIRIGKIEQDLVDLEWEGDITPLPATERFVNYVHEKIDTNPIALVGVLYVEEGATNGNKYIAKKLIPALGLGEGKALGFLDPHGDEQRAKWNAFKETLNELDLTEEEEATCVESAQETFRMIMNISNELSAANV